MGRWLEWGGALSTDIMKNDCMKNTERQTTRSATTAAVAILSGEIIRLPSVALAAVLAGGPPPPCRRRGSLALFLKMISLS